ncbi:MAG: hypothetical protein AAFU60_00190 [Bacteroidota bacterium]
METSLPLDDNYTSSETFQLSPQIKTFLKETAKWAKFISIVGFVFVGLMILGAIFATAFLSSLGSEQEFQFPFPPFLFSVIYLIFAAIAFFPVLYLYRFANNMQIALQRGDQNVLNSSFENLKAHYKFYGITLAIVLGFYALMLVLSIIGGAAAMF